jgi:hypothetical protein
MFWSELLDGEGLPEVEVGVIGEVENGGAGCEGADTVVLSFAGGGRMTSSGWAFRSWKERS